jgi:hypothetical protein
MESFPTTDQEGTITWRSEEGVVHREDGPAITFDDGTEEWYLDGIPHNPNGPAITDSLGNKKWYYKGMKHRVGGPAIEFSNGDYVYYYEDLLHREDGPASSMGGELVWFLHGKVVYSDMTDTNPDFEDADLSEALKQSIIKYRLKS